MAKYLGSHGLERMKSKWQNNAQHTHVTLEDELGMFPYKVVLTPDKYRMCDLFPDTYKTIKEVPADLDFSQLQDVQELFKGCEALESVDGLDLSNAVNARSLFEGCTSLKSVTNLIAPNVVDWTDAFFNCSALATLGELDLGKATKTHFMFCGCKSLPEKIPWVLDLRAALTGTNMTRCNGMFSDSSVKDITIKDSLVINFTAYGSLDEENGSHGSYNRGWYLHYMAENALIEYAKRHEGLTANSLDLTIPLSFEYRSLWLSKGAGYVDYKVTIPDVADWLNGGALRELRANYLLGLATMLKQDCPANGVYKYTEPTFNDDGSVKTPWTLKSYEDAPENYEDITIYTPTIDTTAHTIVFVASTKHILKQPITLTIF